MKKSRQRAPNGYRIVKCSDGFYHVYGPGGDCLREVLSHAEALQVARIHRDKIVEVQPELKVDERRRKL